VKLDFGQPIAILGAIRPTIVFHAELA